MLVLEIEECTVNWVSIFTVSNYLRLGSLLRYGSLLVVIKLAFSPPAILDGEEKLSQNREANRISVWFLIIKCQYLSLCNICNGVCHIHLIVFYHILISNILVDKVCWIFIKLASFRNNIKVFSKREKWIVYLYFKTIICCPIDWNWKSHGYSIFNNTERILQQSRRS